MILEKPDQNKVISNNANEITTNHENKLCCF